MRIARLQPPEGASPSYMVAWRESSDAVFQGNARLEDAELVLRGSGPDGAVVRRRVALAEVASVRIGRRADERIRGTRSVILELRGGDTVTVAPLGAGEVFELAELVAELRSTEARPVERVAVVVPLRKGTAAKARALVSGGPPFELQEHGLQGHQVYVTDREAIVVFEGDAVRETLERLIRSPRVAADLGRWRECLAGKPRLADEAYSSRNVCPAR
jgi:hypothetical protein